MFVKLNIMKVQGSEIFWTGYCSSSYNLTWHLWHLWFV